MENRTHQANQCEICFAPCSPNQYRAKKDLQKLAADGHFLKGSSATLGLTKVQECCEKIQHYGNGKNEAGDPDAHSSDTERLANIKKEVALARREYAIVEAKLRKFFNEP